MDGPNRVGVELMRFPSEEGGAEYVAFTPDGGRIVTCGQAGAVRMWNLATRMRENEFHGKDGPLHSFAVTGADGSIMTCGYDGQVRLWDLQHGPGPAFEPRAEEGAGRVAVSGTGVAITGNEAGAVRLWDVAGRKQIGTLGHHPEPVRAVALSADGKTALSGGGGQWKGDRWVGADFDVRVWDVAARVERGRLKGHTDAVGDAALFPDGAFAVTSGRDGTLRLWRLSDFRQLAVATAHADGAGCVALLAGGRRVLSGGTDMNVKLWQLPPLTSGTERAEFVPLATWGGHANVVMHVAVSPDETRAASVGREGTVIVWKLPEFVP